jgi:flagellar protein FlaH
MLSTKKVLVIDDNPESRSISKTCLLQEGYYAITASSGAEGLSKAQERRPDLVMIDMMVADVGWSDIARTLRTDPANEHLPIVILADADRLDELVIGPGSNADDVLVKPFSPSDLAVKVLPLLGAEDERKRTVVSTGNGELDTKMGGGVPVGSLTLIEGSSGAGKSVLVQQMIWGSLQEGFTLALFTSENTVKSLIRQMRSLSLEVVDFLLLSRLRIYPMEVARLGGKAPRVLMEAMRKEKHRDMIFIDSATAAISGCADEDVLGFFEDCKRLCAAGLTVVIVLHAHGIGRELLVRIRSICDAHLQLRTEEVRQRLVKTLEVTKIRGADKNTGNILSFEVEPGWGMRLIPISKVKG